MFKDPNSKKIEVVARNLLRLYQYIQKDKPITQEDILKDLEIDTPNEALQNEITQLKLEIEGTREENLAFRQNSLQNQVEIEENIDTYEFQLGEMHSKFETAKQEFQSEKDSLTENHDINTQRLEQKILQRWL